MTESSFRLLLLRFALIPILSVCGFLALLGYQLRQVSAHRFEGAQATTVLLQVDRLQKSVIDQETGIRGYLVSNNTEFLQPYRDATARFQGELFLLQESAPPNSALSAKIAAIVRDDQSFDAINQKLLDGDLPTDTRIDLLRQQKQAMGTLRAEFTDIYTEQNNIREANRSRLTKILGRFPAIGIGGGALIAILLIWYGGGLFREIVRAYHAQLDETELQRDSLQASLQSIADAVIVCDSAGKITMLNPAAEDLTGRPRSLALGQPLTRVFQAIDERTRLPVENPVEQVKRLNTVVTVENQATLLRRDGTEIPIDESSAPIRNRDGSLSGVVLVLRSVAERRAAANLLRQNQERLDAIYNTSLEYIGLLDPEGIVLECNRASLEFAGNTRDELVGKPYWNCAWFTHTPGMPEQVRAAVARAAAGRSTHTDMALTRPSGDVIHFDFSLSPVFDAAGNVLYLVPEARDISELKRAQLALVRSEKLAAVGRLAASIAHEINNPLEAVTNLLYLARTHAESSEVSGYLEAADHELRRVSGIANQTLRFHRQSSNPEPVQASELLSTVLSIYEGRLRNSNIKVDISHRTEDPIMCFGGDVRQVLNNLVGNAIDAMSGNLGGGRLLIRSQKSTDWPTGRKGVVFTIADTGAGIPRDALSHIFEPFFTTKGVAGTGLGLWVSKEVVTRHNGTLRVRSSDLPHHSGTVFRFFLPFA
ncbi:MAG TPA: PAS domain S-box protein [Acidobacteriaceae bacterium]|jgi:PAS domain S-box-containing protein